MFEARSNSFIWLYPNVDQSVDYHKKIKLLESVVAGSIPTKVGLLLALEALCLYNHQLTGTIPTEIGRLSGLHWLWLGNKRLIGTVPSEMGLLTSLNMLVL